MIKLSMSTIKKVDVKQEIITYLNENENNGSVVEKNFKFMCYFSNLG